MQVELEERIKDLESQLRDSKKSNEYLQSRIDFYENDGVGKLYYSLQRKANEMADLLNMHSLTLVPIDDPKDKTFDRLKAVWADAKGLSSAIKELAVIAGIGVDGDGSQEPKQQQKEQPRRILTAEAMADSVGELAGKKQD